MVHQAICVGPQLVHSARCGKPEIVSVTIMIVFDLKCFEGHTFEGWFQDSSSFEDQQREGLVVCPICQSTQVEKIPSGFAMKSSISEPSSVPESVEAGRKFLNFLEKNFENVGCDFTREALKMHYGAAEPRNIRGVSSQEEEKLLKEEGIPFFKLPVPASSESDS